MEDYRKLMTDSIKSFCEEKFQVEARVEPPKSVCLYSPSKPDYKIARIACAGIGILIGFINKYGDITKIETIVEYKYLLNKGVSVGKFLNTLDTVKDVLPERLVELGLKRK